MPYEAVLPPCCLCRTTDLMSFLPACEPIMAGYDICGCPRLRCLSSNVQLPAGEHIVAGDDIYGGTSRLLSAVLPAQGVEVTNVDHTDIKAYEAAFRPNTKLVLLESPTNPRMQARCNAVSACLRLLPTSMSRLSCLTSLMICLFCSYAT
jgi:Cys/Met metabolism PLP-dependent enzyme